MAIHLRRREFIFTLGGAAAALPIAARAQQPERTRRIGVLMNRAADNSEGQDRLAAFHQGLQELGWSVGRNVRIETRWGVDDAWDRMHDAMKEARSHFERAHPPQPAAERQRSSPRY